MVAGVLLMMNHLRGRVLAMQDSPQYQAAWDEWVAAAKQQDGVSSPVKRRPPKSPEPPALVLLRDHYWTCTGGVLLLSTALAVAFIFMLRGVMFQPPLEIDPADPTEKPAIS